MDDRVQRRLRRHAIWIALRGVAAIAFGIVAIAWPSIALVALTLLFGAYVVADALFAFQLAYRLRRSDDVAWPFALTGLVGLAAGGLALAWPETAALSLVLLLGLWSIVLGALQLVVAYRLRDVFEDELWLGLSGVLSLLFGVFVIVFPVAVAYALGVLVGVWAVVFGLAMLLFAARVRRDHGPSESTSRSTVTPH